MRHKLGRLQKEVLAQLYAGVTLQLLPNSSHNKWVVSNIVKEWEDEERRSLNRAVASLYESRLVTEKHNEDETVTLVLSDKGQNYAMTVDLDRMEVVKPKKWDERWRVVLSDIPEKQKNARDAFRQHLKQLDFIEFQKSVWVHAYDCRMQIDFLVEFYGVRRYVRYGLLEDIDNDLHLRKQFDLL
ncbi:MAG TPA: hypothetical protein VJG48_00850 [Candidatus Paceibacterota bacterium]